jgi:uncharacterized protein
MARDSFSGDVGHWRAGALRRLLVFGLAAAASIVGLRLLPFNRALDVSQTAGLQAYFWLLAVSLLIAHVVVLRLFHGWDWSYAGLGRTALEPRPLAISALIGALAIGVPSGLLLAAGFLRAEPAASGSSLATGAGFALLLFPAALWEELAMRGYFLSVLRDTLNAPAALALTSTLFGALHMQQAGATAMSTLAVTLAGFFLGTIRLATGSLYAALSAHLAWNLMLAAVLHTPLSGIGLAAPDYRVLDDGPDWLTGGSWGPEGGLAAMLGLLAGLLIFKRPWRRGGSDA